MLSFIKFVFYEIIIQFSHHGVLIPNAVQLVVMAKRPKIEHALVEFVRLPHHKISYKSTIAMKEIVSYKINLQLTWTNLE